MSLIVFGVDEYSWTAYFFVDTYYGKQDSTSHYLQKKLDAPSGGYTGHNSPVWDPRYYFLTVLSIRLSQVTLEWSSLVQTIEANLDPHVRTSPQRGISLLTIHRVILTICLYRTSWMTTQLWREQNNALGR
jgi:hypothetical protein